MPVTPFSDRTEIIRIIAEDNYIHSLGFTRENILNTSYTDDELSPERLQIFVFNAASEKGDTPIYISSVTEVDISVPISSASKAEMAAEQIIALLQGKEICGHTALELVPPSPVNLPCQSGFECIGLRFRYNATLFNTVKTDL